MDSPSPQASESPNQSSPQSPEHQSQPGQDYTPEGNSDSGSQTGDEIADALAYAEREFSDKGEKATEEKDGGVGTKGISKDERQETQTKDKAPTPPEPVDRVKPSALASFHRQQKEFEAQRQSFAQEKSEIARFKSILDNAKTDRIAAIEAMGYPDVKTFLEGLAEDGGRMTPERQKLQELEKWKNDQEKQREEQTRQWQQQQEQQAIQGKLDALKGQVETTLKAEGFASRLVNIEGASDQIMLEMDRMATETGEMPQIEDAIKSVENKFRGSLAKLADNPEVLQFFREKLEATKSSSMATPQSKTRANRQTLGSNVRAPGLQSTTGNRPYDEEAVEAEAIAWLNQNTR